MSSLIQVILLVIIMGTTSYLAGLLPLIVTLSSEKMAIASLLSMGILVSTSLVIVIPEGIETIIEADSSNTDSIGLLLLSGFLLMFLFDHIGSITTLQQIYYKIVPQPQTQQQYGSQSPLYIVHSVLTSSITFGLLIHALVDGIALGTSFTKVDNFHLIIFLSIIIHKIPTCFSLVTILIKENYSFSIIKFHLLAFALSSPISCLITYFALSIGTINQKIVGSLLLFSGGTFLYVVIHVMLDTLSKDGKADIPQSQDSEYTISEEADNNDAPSKSNGLSSHELLASILGMIIPVAISLLGGDH